jgi:hypothetical protein
MPDRRHSDAHRRGRTLALPWRVKDAREHAEASGSHVPLILAHVPVRLHQP